MKRRKLITKETISAVVSLVSAIICTLFAGCRLTVGNLQLEQFEAEVCTTNLVSIIGD